MKLTEKDILELHKKYAQNENILDIVWIHSQIVKEIAVSICTNLKKRYGIKPNIDLVKIGALFHDIGFYKCFDKNLNKIEDKIRHGDFGYEILKKEKIPEEIARFALVHIGVGVGENIPITLEEEIVAYADNFHSKDKKGIENFEEQKEKLEKFGKDKGIVMERFKIKFGIPKLK